MKPWLQPLALLLAGLALFQFGGHLGVLRSHGGDVLVTWFLVASLAAARIGDRPSRTALVAVIALTAEAIQALGWISPQDGAAWQLTLGSTFDPWDVVAYAVGLGVAWWAVGDPSPTLQAAAAPTPQQ